MSTPAQIGIASTIKTNLRKEILMKKQSVSTIIAASLLLSSSSIMTTPLPELYLAALGTISVATNMRQLMEDYRKEIMMRDASNTEVTRYIDTPGVTHPSIKITCKDKYWYASCTRQQQIDSRTIFVPIKKEGNAVTVSLIEPTKNEPEEEYKARIESQLEDFEASIIQLLRNRANNNLLCSTGESFTNE
jgi:hypothetical protein